MDTNDYCKICRREMDRRIDPTTEDCGGDCLRCMAECGDPTCREAMQKLEPGDVQWAEAS